MGSLDSSVSFEVDAGATAVVSRNTGSGFVPLSGVNMVSSAVSDTGYSTAQRVHVSDSFRDLFYGDASLGFVNDSATGPEVSSKGPSVERNAHQIRK